MEKEDWIPPEESEAKAAWTSLLWRSKVEGAEASRSPESCFALHSSPELLQTNVKTPISRSLVLQQEGDERNPKPKRSKARKTSENPNRRSFYRVESYTYTHLISCSYLLFKFLLLLFCPLIKYPIYPSPQSND